MHLGGSVPVLVLLSCRGPAVSGTVEVGATLSFLLQEPFVSPDFQRNRKISRKALLMLSVYPTSVCVYVYERYRQMTGR